MYSFQGCVRYSEVDEKGVLSVVAMLNYLQDCVLFQSESLGVGIDWAQRTGRSWFLAAWGVEIARMPRFAETIKVTTWATGFSGLFGRRNFAVLDAEGTEMVRADSSWFLFDASVGRPVRILDQDIEPYRADLEGNRPLDMVPAPRRVALEGPGEAAAPVTVTRAHIDTNHHVNNAQYVGMALAALPKGTKVRRLDVQYCSAARLGDVVQPCVHTIEGGYAVGLADAGGNLYAAVRVLW